jgi:cation-transporting ATPase E
MPGPLTDLATTTAGLDGLSSSEAEARRRRGEGNEAGSASSRSYARIVRTNVLNVYNTILFVIGAALLALGRYSDALISVSIRLLNAVQEIRAKRQLAQLQLLARSAVVGGGSHVRRPV